MIRSARATPRIQGISRGLTLCLVIGLLLTAWAPALAQSSNFKPTRRRVRAPGTETRQGVVRTRTIQLMSANSTSSNAACSRRANSTTPDRSSPKPRVNYQQSLLAALFEDQYVSVRKAVKQRDENGRKSVHLEIENSSGGGAELEHSGRPRMMQSFVPSLPIVSTMSTSRS